jgi:hypothetical protein
MNKPEVLDGMVSDLIRRGLPADYATRAAAEFADHHRDLVEELQATGLSESQATTEASKRLGNARTLMKKTVREYQRRYWCARWPLVTFLLAPIPLLLLSSAATMLALFCVEWSLEKTGVIGPYAPDGIISWGEWWAEKLMLVSVGFAAPAFTMLALVRLTKRAALDWKWLAVSGCVLGLTVGMNRCQFPEAFMHPTTMDGKPVPADQPLITLGVPLFAQTWRGAWKWYTQDLQQICQVLLPLGFAAIVAMRAKRMSQRASLMVSASSYPELQGGEHEHARVA